MTCYSPLQVAQEVVNQHGSKAQAWVAAALVDGIESNGCTDDKNPSSTACGLFQFLTTTWAGNGGGQFAPTACGATMSQQVTVFLTASAGNNFYPWAPDLGGSYNGDTKQPAATTPQPGSKVANAIATLASSGGLGKLLGNVPTNWADAGAASPGVTAGTGDTSSASANPCRINFPLSINTPIGSIGGCLLSSSQVKAITGAAALFIGAGVFAFGVVMLAAYGYDQSGAKQAVNQTASHFGFLGTGVRRLAEGGALLGGQPEVAAGLEARGRVKKAQRKAKAASSSSSSSDEPKQAGRLESRRINRRFAEAERQQGPIGPRGANPTSARIAREGRRGRSVPGPGRRPSAAQRDRAHEAVRARRRAEGFERVS